MIENENDRNVLLSQEYIESARRKKKAHTEHNDADFKGGILKLFNFTYEGRLNVYVWF